MLKKILKIVGIVLVVFTASLFAIPYFFKDQIKAKITEAINEKVDAKVSFADADLSLFKNFFRNIQNYLIPHMRRLFLWYLMIMGISHIR